jgi:hypothetical protein
VKRVRVGKAPSSLQAVAAEPTKGEEAFQISEGKEDCWGGERIA